MTRWTEDDAILLDHYARSGAEACHKLLPNRSLMAIYQRAHKLGLHYLHSPSLPKSPELLYPMSAENRVAWDALNNYRAAEPANNGLFRRFA